jgi:hypothetical protein
MHRVRTAIERIGLRIGKARQRRRLNSEGSRIAVFDFERRAPALELKFDPSDIITDHAQARLRIQYHDRPILELMDD